MINDQKINVLLVDDQLANQHTFTIMLDSPEYTLVKASSGKEALRILEEQEFAVILLDVLMPEMDGFETAQHIRERENCRDTPIIFLTALDDSEESVCRGYSFHAIDYMYKPISRKILQAKVAVLVDMYKKSKKIERQAALLRTSEQNLEKTVMQRTAELQEANRKLMLEIGERKQVEANLEKERRELEQHVEERTYALRDSLKKFEDTNLRLEHANRAKAGFLASMSHELRTPLNSILGFSEVLEAQYFGHLNEKQLGYVHHIANSGKHLLSLINDLLDTAKIDAGAMEMALEPTEAEEFIRTVLGMLKLQFRKKRLKVETVFDLDLPVFAADIRKCKQIMLNLLSNAIKYTSEGGRISVCTEQKGDKTLRTTVSDTGIGIAPKDLDRIFSEFRQADQVRDEAMGGTGIGLALTRRLVELHGGEIGVESKLGEGSSFWFTLPLKKFPSSEAWWGQEDRTAPVYLRGRRILIAENNEVNLAMLVDMLSMYEHKLFVAKNGEEAVELALLHKPEVILMDMRMPGIDGLEATRQLRAMPAFADMPIIALTAQTGRDAEEEQKHAGCTEHLAKPVAKKELLEVLQRYLEQK
ncbi:MAG: response regulator [Gammaproteobacteria bacterium]|nr:response regulator [Gammaproteobacteria bacterium]